MEINLLPTDSGKKISCKIKGKEVTEGEIYYYHDKRRFYIFQNVELGATPYDCEDYNGYDYSYHVGDGTIKERSIQSVTNLKFLSKIREIWSK